MAAMNCRIRTACKYNVRLNKNKAAFQMYLISRTVVFFANKWDCCFPQMHATVLS